MKRMDVASGTGGAAGVGVLGDMTPFRMLPGLRGAPQPFPYQGSKRHLANAIIPLIPRDARRVIEPFCGSAAVSVAARYAGKVDDVILADVNAPLIGLWNAIIGDPEPLIAEYGRMWNEQQADPKAYFLAVRDTFNADPQPARLLYLMNRIVKGAIRYGCNGNFNQSADNRRLGAKPETVASRIREVSRVMQGATAVTEDYTAVCATATAVDVIYMDPPYQGTSNSADHRYMAGLDREEYEAALAGMNARGLSYMVSYDMVDDAATYGRPLSGSLGLTHLHLLAGASTQATLLGRRMQTVESLYLSPALVERLGGAAAIPRLLNPEDDMRREITLPLVGVD